MFIQYKVTEFKTKQKNNNENIHGELKRPFFFFKNINF